MPFLTDGESKPIYRDGTLRGGATRKHDRCSSACILKIKYTKEEHLLKPQLENMPAMPVMEVNLREDNPPCQPTPIRSAVARARKIL